MPELYEAQGTVLRKEWGTIQNFLGYCLCTSVLEHVLTEVLLTNMLHVNPEAEISWAFLSFVINFARGFTSHTRVVESEYSMTSPIGLSQVRFPVLFCSRVRMLPYNPH